MKKAVPKKQDKPADPFADSQTLSFMLPHGFLLLCKLWNITPETILTTFMEDLSCGSWKREGRDEAKTHLQQYAISMRFGHQRYTAEDTRQMFIELDAIGMLWPATKCTDKMLNLHIKWRKQYYRFWYRKWKNKYKPSKRPIEILE